MSATQRQSRASSPTTVTERLAVSLTLWDGEPEYLVRVLSDARYDNDPAAIAIRSRLRNAIGLRQGEFASQTKRASVVDVDAQGML